MPKKHRFEQEEAEVDSEHSNIVDSSEDDENVPDEFEEDNFIYDEEEDEDNEGNEEDEDDESGKKRKRVAPPLWMDEEEESSNKRRKVGGFKRLKKKKSALDDDDEVIEHTPTQRAEDDGDDISSFIVGKTRDDMIEQAGSSLTATIFGDDYGMVDEDFGEDDELDEAEGNKYLRLRKHFSADELKSKFMTEEDDRIREVDIAERVYCLHEDRTLNADEVAKESAWIVSQLFKSVDKDSVPKIQNAVSFVLKKIYIEKLDIPYIAYYLKEYWVDSFTKESLWDIWDMDKKWVKLQGKKQVVRSLYESSTAQIPDLYKDILREASTSEEVKDLSLHFQLHFAIEGADEVKRPSKRDFYTIVKKASNFDALSKDIAISAYEYSHNLRSGMTLHTVKDPELEPEEFASHHTTRQFGTPASVLKALRHIHAFEIAKEPHILSLIRQCYEKYATISTSVTPKGQTAGIFKGSVSRNLRSVSLNAFTESEERYLELMKILRAKREDLLAVEVEVGNEELDFALDAATHYFSDKSNEVAVAWNRVRQQIVDEVKSLVKQEMSDYVLDYFLRGGLRLIGRLCTKILYSRLVTGPYVYNFEGSEKQFDKTAPKIDTNFQYYPPKGMSQFKNPPVLTKHSVLACSPGKTKSEPIVFVFLDPNGNVQETVMWRFPPYISRFARAQLGKADPTPIPDSAKNDQQLKQEKLLLLNIRKFRPDVLAVGTSGLDCQLVYRVIDEVQEKLPEDSRLRMQFVNDEIAHLFESSDLANSELKEVAPIIRRTISLGRYFNNPLVEIARLMNQSDDLLFLTVHPLQDMLRKSDLRFWMEQAFINAVNEVGVDLNRIIPHKHLQAPLQFVSGLGPRKADFLLRFLNSRGELHSRDDLKQVFGKNVFNNCAGFLRITSTKSVEDEAVQFRPLDNTRVHPSDYSIAKKICFDALDVEDDEDDEAIWSLMEMYDENGNWIGEDQDKLEELDLDLYAQNMEELGYGKKLLIIKNIKEELKCPFRDTRKKYTPMNERDVFYASLKETPDSFGEGSLVFLNISDVLPKKIFGHLDNGVKGFINAVNLPFSKGSLNQRYSVDQSIEAVILRVDYSEFLIELSATESDLARYRTDPENKASTSVKKERRFLTRNIDHPYFKNFNNEEAMNYLKDKRPGECVIRPSSRGLTFLTLAYKWFGGSIVNVEIREEKKKMPLSLGEELWVKKNKFVDLDELHYNMVDLVMEKAEQVVSNPKYSDAPKEQIYENLKREKANNPAIIPYRLGVYDKYPGKFYVFYLPGTSTVLYEPFSVSAEGFHFANQSFQSPTQLINHFKKNFKELPSFKRRQAANGY